MPATATCHYITVATLAALVREYRRSRVVPNDLGAAFLQLAGGVWDRYHFTDSRDDFAQDVAIHLLQTPLEKADVARNLFAYFTTCAIRYGFKLRNKAHAERRRFETYAEGLLASGAHIPRILDNPHSVSREEYRANHPDRPDELTD